MSEDKQEFDILDWRPMEAGEALYGEMIELEDAPELLGTKSTATEGYLLADGPGNMSYFPGNPSADDQTEIDNFEAQNLARGRCCGFARIPCCAGRILVRICLPKRCVWYTLRYRCRHGRRVCHHTIRVHCR